MCRSRPGSAPSCDEPLLIRPLWHVTNLAPSHEPHPIPGDAFIDAVPNPSGQNPKAGRKRPWRAQAFGHSNARFRFEPGDPVLDEHVGFIIVGIEPVMHVESATEPRLRRQQPVFRPTIVAEHEPRPSGTERAKSV